MDEFEPGALCKPSQCPSIALIALRVSTEFVVVVIWIASSRSIFLREDIDNRGPESTLRSLQAKIQHGKLCRERTVRLKVVESGLGEAGDQNGKGAFLHRQQLGATVLCDPLHGGKKGLRLCQICRQVIWQPERKHRGSRTDWSPWPTRPKAIGSSGSSNTSQ